MLQEVKGSIVVWGVCVLCLLCACKAPAEGERASSADDSPRVDGWSQEEWDKIKRLSPYGEGEVPKVVDETNRLLNSKGAAALGQALFFDVGLSADKKVSCANCHDPRSAFSVTSAVGGGVGGAATLRHPPGLINVAYQRWFDWDGKADSLWSQAVRPLEGAGEQALSRVGVVRHVAGVAEYRRVYELVVGEPMPGVEEVAQWPEDATPTGSKEQREAWAKMPSEVQERVNKVFVNLLKSLGAYQSKLVSFDSKFDRYVRAQVQGKGAESFGESERRGLGVFLGKGRCVVCHNGPLLSDMSFHNLGLAKAGKDEGRWVGVEEVKRGEMGALGVYSDDTKGDRASWTRFLKQTPEDRGQFKTAMLRHVAKSGPYMHTGEFETLRQVIEFYNALPGQQKVGHREDSLVPLGLTEQEKVDLEAFLRTLTLEPLDEALLHPAPLSQVK